MTAPALERVRVDLPGGVVVGLAALALPCTCPGPVAEALAEHHEDMLAAVDALLGHPRWGLGPGDARLSADSHGGGVAPRRPHSRVLAGRAQSAAALVMLRDRLRAVPDDGTAQLLDAPGWRLSTAHEHLATSCTADDAGLLLVQRLQRRAARAGALS